MLFLLYDTHGDMIHIVMRYSYVVPGRLQII